MDPMIDTSLKGRLVVAAPKLHDGNFDGTVVLILEHGEEGAIGLILNRPTDISSEELLPDLALPVAEPTTVFLGGPVGRDEAVGLARVPEGVRLVHLGSEAPIDGDPDSVEVVRVYVGHAGWGPGQLEAELDAGTWFIVDAEAEDPFSQDPAGLWRAVLARQGGLFTTVPPDPSMN
jgi:putative transcriptional regulator